MSGLFRARPTTRYDPSPRLSDQIGAAFQGNDVVATKTLAAAEILKLRGIRWLRWAVSADRVNPTDGTWSYANYDTVLDGLVVTRGFRVVGTLGLAQSWNSTSGTDTHAPPTDYAKWLLYVTTTVRRYRDRIHHWEVWNEPDLTAGFWIGGTPAQYAELLGRAYNAIKAEDPGATVVLGGLARAGVYVTDFLDQIVADATYPALKFFEVGNYHNYDPDTTATHDAYMRGLLQGKPYWCTEHSYSSVIAHQGQAGYQSGAASQEKWWRDHFLMPLKLGADKVFWLGVFDSADGSAYENHSLCDTVPAAKALTCDTAERYVRG